MTRVECRSQEVIFSSLSPAAHHKTLEMKGDRPFGPHAIATLAPS
ncbi:hypothetical protein [Laspinema palackyanum]